MIRVRGLAFAYSQVRVLESVDLDLGSGLHLILGPNGCGKSTLLRLIAGIEMPSGGSVEIDGFDLWKHEVEARRRLTYVPEHPDLTPFANLREIARLVARLRGASVEEADAALDALGMYELHRRSVRELSLGQRRRALLATARIATPPHVLLDEPLEALDRSSRAETLRWIEQRRAAGTSVAVISHDLEPFISTPATAGYLGQGRWHGKTSATGFSEAELEELARARTA